MYLFRLSTKKGWTNKVGFFSTDLLRLAKNVIYSSIGQLITLASPLLITPYLVRTLGIEKFGLIISAQSIMMYISYLVDYSFNIDATQEASINRDNYQSLTIIFSEIVWTKIVLVLISLPIVVIIMYSIPIFNDHKLLFIFSYSIVLGKSFIPQWLLIGTERIKEYTALNIVSKIIVYASIFLFINNPSRYIYVNLLWGMGEILLLPIIYQRILSKMQINRLLSFSWKLVIARLIKGWPLFISNSMNGLYIYSNITILSIFANPRILGSFAIAEKVMLLVKQIAGIILQATYPHACKLNELPGDGLKRFLRNETYLFAALFTSIGIIVAGFADYITLFFVGKFDNYASNLLRVLAFVPLIVSLNMSATQMMLIKGIRKKYTQVVISACIINVLINFTLAPIFGPIGTVTAIVITEIFNTLALHWSLLKYYPALQIFNTRRLVLLK